MPKKVTIENDAPTPQEQPLPVENVVESAKPTVDSAAQDDVVMVEDLDDDEELYPGGPKLGEVKKWKEEYGEVYVTSVTPDLHIVWRPIRRSEYRRLVGELEAKTESKEVTRSQANLDNEESIAEICIIDPPYSRNNESSGLAGVASTISNQVMEASGFSTYDVRQL